MLFRSRSGRLCWATMPGRCRGRSSGSELPATRGLEAAGSTWRQQQPRVDDEAVGRLPISQLGSSAEAKQLYRDGTTGTRHDAMDDVPGTGPPALVTTSACGRLPCPRQASRSRQTAGLLHPIEMTDDRVTRR